MSTPVQLPAKKKILLTGAAGFIGCHTALRLLARGDDVVIVDEVNDYYDVRIKRLNLKKIREAPGGDKVKIYEKDVCDHEFLAKVFEEEKFDAICHLAARAGVRPSIEHPELYTHSNVEGTMWLLELCKRFGVKHFVYASSSSVYGGMDTVPFSEKMNVDKPVSPYAASKKACELFAYTYYHLYGINSAGLRFFTVYGPSGRPDMAPFMFMDRIYQGKPISQFGDGSSSRDYTYVDDIVDGVIASIDKPLGYQIFNLGNSHPINLVQFISTIEKVVGKKATINILPEQPGDVPRTYADVSHAHELLGYQPKVMFEDGMRRCFDWYIKEYLPFLNSQ